MPALKTENLAKINAGVLDQDYPNGVGSSISVQLTKNNPNARLSSLEPNGS